MIGACLLVAGVVAARIPDAAFTLRWTHSIEKILWEEDYEVRGATLLMTGYRVRGSGAGMEPGPDAVWRDGAWHTATRRSLPELSIVRSPYAPDYEWCARGRCRPLADWLGSPTEPQYVTVRACAAERLESR